MQEARDYWKGSKCVYPSHQQDLESHTLIMVLTHRWNRILLGRNSVIRKALGSTPESEHLPNSSKIAAALEGDVGLLFTDEDQVTVEEWFESYKKPDFARAGNIALEGFVVPEGERAWTV